MYRVQLEFLTSECVYSVGTRAARINKFPLIIERNSEGEIFFCHTLQQEISQDKEIVSRDSQTLGRYGPNTTFCVKWYMIDVVWAVK